MNFNTFEENFFYNLKNENNEYVNNILTNEKIINSYLSDSDSKSLKSFVNKFNSIIITSNNKNYKFYENILTKKIFNYVLRGFRNSDILIRACEVKNKNLLKWLLTMDINTCIQNEDGVSALMVASRDPDLLFVVKYLLSHDEINKNLCDKNGENALFYAVHNIETFRLLLDSNVDPNHLNQDKDSILTYCCRNKIYNLMRTLSVRENLDVNTFNNDERTALMYMMEDGRYSELRDFVAKDKKGINFYFKNGKNETAFSVFFKKYYEYYRQINVEKIIPYIKVIKNFVDMGVNLNVPIDEEGNTPMMFFNMIEDWVSMAYIIVYYKNLDLSIKNNKGESFTSFCFKHKPTKQSNYSSINAKYLMYDIFSSPTFDASCKDRVGNNIFINYIISYPINYEDNVLDVLRSHKEFSSLTNDNQENLLIVATKIGCRDIIKYIVAAEGCDVNQQDILGNTALHYAVMLRDNFIVNLLAYYHADINIKNKEGKSPINMINESGDSTMKKFVLKPCTPYEFQKKEKKSKKNNDSIFSFGKTYEFSELNVNLRREYLKKYNSDDINDEKSEHKYINNVTPKFNTEYFTGVFKEYFPAVVDALNNDYVRRDLLYGNNVLYATGIINEIENVPRKLINMLTNKDLLRYNRYIDNLDYFLSNI